MVSRYALSWKIGGEAGFGIKSVGQVFAKVCNSAGYEVFGYSEYPSLIRGGHTTYQVVVSERSIGSTAENIDILVALDTETFKRHGNQLSHGGAVVYDKTTTPIVLTSTLKEMNIKLVDVPLMDIIKQVQGAPVMRNTVALAATLALVGLPFSLLTQKIKRSLVKKPNLIDANIAAAKKGYEYVKKTYATLDFKIHLPSKSAEEEMLLTGNDALCLGALAAGLQFYVAYPMTPSSSILHYLAAHADSQRLIVKHAEDEISVINMALGASHVGARAMIGTSGGGFSLMVEALGLAGITETPLVIVNAQRPGPATGLPTWTEQGDLRFVMHAAQGEFPRIVLAPGDHEECFWMTAEAFNLAEQYQLPVIILTDKFLGESDRTVKPFDARRVTINRGQSILMDAQVRSFKDYKRYRMTPSGVSPRSIPGQQGGMYLANSDEHDEYGYTSEEARDRVTQMHKRMQKLHSAAAKMSGATLYGNPRAKNTIVSWGSTKGPIQDAIAWLPERVQRKVNFLHLTTLWPFPADAVKRILSRSRATLLVENNATAQLGGIIRQYTGIRVEHALLKFDGRPMYPTEIKERILDL